MARVTIEDCLPNVPSRFALTILAAKRTRQLMAGARELVDAKNKPPVLSLREIAAAKVSFEKNPEASGRTGIL
ncbi:MAG: DNA-directed RNA polymerase subunit omega [Deltaproteobacteria bacterium]|nr:DNA-directed RNA polymerase subunit omega [Deltaproteobacteria bacterium]